MTMPVPMPVDTLTRHIEVLGSSRGVLPQCCSVRVVGGEHRDPGQSRLDVLGDGIAVPAGQDRRLAGPPGLGVDRTRKAQAGSAQLVRGDAGSVEQVRHGAAISSSTTARPRLHGDVDLLLGDQRAAEVGDRDAGVGRVDRRDERP